MVVISGILVLVVTISVITLMQRSPHTKRVGVRTLGVPSSVTPVTTPPALPDGVVQFVRKAAAQLGDPRPAGHYVATTEDAATRGLLAGSSSVTTPVWAIALQGSFTDNDAQLMAGASPPTGSTAIFTYDRSTGTSMDFALNNSNPDLSTLGPVGTLDTSNW